MKEIAEKEIPLGLRKKSKRVVDEIENTALEMESLGWRLTNTSTDKALRFVILTFERELPEP